MHMNISEFDKIFFPPHLLHIFIILPVLSNDNTPIVSLKEYFAISNDQLCIPFNSISTEFLALMKKVAKSPLVMDVLNIPAVQRSLERLADLLGKIQKALGEYLERERASFPRYGWTFSHLNAFYIFYLYFASSNLTFLLPLRECRFGHLK